MVPEKCILLIYFIGKWSLEILVIIGGEKLICRNWTFSKREQSLQSLIRVIFADSNDI